MAHEHLKQVYEILATQFHTEELKDLCFQFDLDYDDLRGEEKRAKARELVAYFERRKRVDELIAAVKLLRPNATWEAGSTTITRNFRVIPESLFDQLLDLVKVQTFWSLTTLVKIYRLCIPQGWSSIIDKDEPKQVLEMMIRNLARVPTALVLLEFIERLIQAPTEPNQVNPPPLFELRRWMAKVIEVLNLSEHEVEYLQQLDMNKSTSPMTFYLLFAITPSLTKRSLFFGTAWIWNENRIYVLHEDEKPRKFSDMHQLLDQQIDKALNRHIIEEDELIIAVLLPLSQLHKTDLDVGSWPIRFGTQSIPLGERFPVVVRSLDRITVSSFVKTWQMWEEKWHNLSDTKRHYWINNYMTDIASIYATIEQTTLLTMDVAPPDAPPERRKQILEAAINTGTPVALWVKQTPDVSTELLRELAPLLAEQLEQLPSRLFHMRRKAAKGLSPIVLFYDNPQQRPPEQILQTPRKEIV